MTYLFEKSLRIYLYGINRYAEDFAGILSNSGYSVEGFLDERFKEYKNGYKGIPVFNYRSVNFDDERCAIIMLQNAMVHDEVAAKLNEFGLRKIIYIPFIDVYDDAKVRMCGLYNRMVYRGELAEYEFDFYDSGSTSSFRIISDGDGWNIVYIPYDLIYTTAVEKDYFDIPILDFTPYRQLFRYLQGEDCDISLYLNRYGIHSMPYTNSETNDGIISGRRKLYSVWERHRVFADSYFEVGAPVASYNEKGYFNLTEGQHRVLYQILKGETFVPLRITDNDLHKSMEKLEAYSKTEAIEGLIKKLSEDMRKDFLE